MRTIFLFLLGSFFFFSVQAQTDSIQHISKLEIKKKKSKSFSSRDSTLILTIDTLIMKDRSRLVFYGKKNVKLQVRHAIIGKNAFIYGTDGKNNGSDMDITIRFVGLESLTVSTAGLDAQNGTRTFPNGNGGKLTLKYLTDGIVPQQVDKKEKAYLSIDTEAGGYSVNAQSDIRNILSQIGRGSRPLGGLPQGQVYSGSPGVDGKSEVIAVTEF
jgi:hypothetical protein